MTSDNQASPDKTTPLGEWILSVSCYSLMYGAVVGLAASALAYIATVWGRHGC